MWKIYLKFFTKYKFILNHFFSRLSCNVLLSITAFSIVSQNLMRSKTFKAIKSKICRFHSLLSFLFFFLFSFQFLWVFLIVWIYFVIFSYLTYYLLKFSTKVIIELLFRINLNHFLILLLFLHLMRLFIVFIHL